LNPGKDRDYPDTHTLGFNLSLHTNSRIAPSPGPKQPFIYTPHTILLCSDCHCINYSMNGMCKLIKYDAKEDTLS